MRWCDLRIPVLVFKGRHALHGIRATARWSLDVFLWERRLLYVTIASFILWIVLHVVTFQLLRAWYTRVPEKKMIHIAHFHDPVTDSNVVAATGVSLVTISGVPYTKDWLSSYDTQTPADLLRIVAAIRKPIGTIREGGTAPPDEEIAYLVEHVRLSLPYLVHFKCYRDALARMRPNEGHTIICKNCWWKICDQSDLARRIDMDRHFDEVRRLLPYTWLCVVGAADDKAAELAYEQAIDPATELFILRQIVFCIEYGTPDDLHIVDEILEKHLTLRKVWERMQTSIYGDIRDEIAKGWYERIVRYSQENRTFVHVLANEDMPEDDPFRVWAMQYLRIRDNATYEEFRTWQKKMAMIAGVGESVTMMFVTLFFGLLCAALHKFLSQTSDGRPIHYWFRGRDMGPAGILPGLLALGSVGAFFLWLFMTIVRAFAFILSSMGVFLGLTYLFTPIVLLFIWIHHELRSLQQPSSAYGWHYDEMMTRTLRGARIRKGVVQGRARVVFNLDECQQLKKGEILVTPYIDKSWESCLSPSGGVVLDDWDDFSDRFPDYRGIVGDKPTVCVDGPVSRIIKTGQLLRVDVTDSGAFVHILHGGEDSQQSPEEEVDGEPR